MDKTLSKYAHSIVAELTLRGITVATAESCTGGGIAAALTSVSGSSEVVRGGVVAYATEVKCSVLHVSADTVRTQGVVSEATVTEMARGALDALGADIAVATSGVTGPTGGTRENPVCTVWIAVAGRQGAALTFRFSDTDRGRARNTRNATLCALKKLFSFVKKNFSLPHTEQKVNVSEN